MGNPGTEKEILRFIRYISFKTHKLKVHQDNPLKIDRGKALKHYKELERVVLEKTEVLKSVMPKVPVWKYYNKPKIMKKKDGSWSSRAIEWFQTLDRLGQSRDTEDTVGEIVEYEDGNPASTEQMKQWLFDLGWTPCTFKFDRNKKTGEEKQIPQVRYFSNNDPRKGELTDSVKSLIETVPELEALDGLTVAKHRMSIFKAFLENSDENGYCVSTAGGFTNTLRFQHRNPFVNLPKSDGEVFMGKEIRGCIIAPEGKIMIGSDVVSLEDTTKRHYMKPHDPSYVFEMEQDGFDPHLDLAIHAGALTQEEIDQKGKSDPSIKHKRKQYKATNYSAVYGVGPPKLARELFIKEREAEALLKAYWERNWSVKKIEKEQYVKTLKDGSMFIKNPISGFCYNLRYIKDVFSTLNQGTGVFVFDTWTLNCEKKGIVIPFEYHDELMTFATEETLGDTIRKLHEAMAEVNMSLNLNVEVKVDVQIGSNYAECH